MTLEHAKIALIGSGMSGLETAAFLAQRHNTLSIVEMAKKIGPGIGFQPLTDVKDQLPNHPVTDYVGHKLVRVLPHRVETEHRGSPVFLEADHIVLSLGVRGDLSLARWLAKVRENVFLLGDASHTGHIADEIHGAFDAAYRLDR